MQELHVWLAFSSNPSQRSRNVITDRTVSNMSSSRRTGILLFRVDLWFALCCLLCHGVALNEPKPTIRFALVLPGNHLAKLKTTFETLLRELSQDNTLSVQLKGFVLNWEEKSRSIVELWTGIQDLIDLNVSGVISFLPSPESELLVFLLRDASIPVIGLSSANQQWPSPDKVRYYDLFLEFSTVSHEMWFGEES